MSHKWAEPVRFRHPDFLKRLISTWGNTLLEFRRMFPYLPPIKYSYQCYCVCLSWIWKLPPSSWCSLCCGILVARNADSGGTKRNRTFVPISSQKPDILIQVIVTSIFNWTDKCACWIYSCVERRFFLILSQLLKFYNYIFLLLFMSFFIQVW